MPPYGQPILRNGNVVLWEYPNHDTQPISVAHAKELIRLTIAWQQAQKSAANHG